MKPDKLLGFAAALISVCILFSGCANGAPPSEETAAPAEALSEYAELKAADNGTVTIPTEGIVQKPRFFNYDADGVTVQLVALRDKHDGVHIAFNTCQSCSPSPKAYYQQAGEVLKCANCGFTFEPEEVGVTQGGCNPWPIADVLTADGTITIPTASLDAMRSTFASWAGPIE